MVQFRPFSNARTGAREMAAGKFEIIETGVMDEGGGYWQWCWMSRNDNIHPPVKPRQRQNHRDDGGNS